MLKLCGKEGAPVSQEGLFKLGSMKKHIISAVKAIKGMLVKKPVLVPKPVVETQQVVITSYSQPHVLQQRMREEKMTHGETVIADLEGVRVEAAYSQKVMYFCPLQGIKIHKRIAKGDGERLPILATVDGLEFPVNIVAGLYKLKNVKLTSNGTLQVHATAKTEWELV